MKRRKLYVIAAIVIAVALMPATYYFADFSIKDAYTNGYNDAIVKANTYIAQHCKTGI